MRNWDEIVAESAYVFTNGHPLLDFPAPGLTKVIPIGGLNVQKGTKTKKLKLSEEWEKVLSARKSTVLVSFGSNMRSVDMPEEYKKVFLSVFETMPETTFIWKYEEEGAKIADHLQNVKLSTWVPQNELLADDRLTTFITHGGLASTMELAFLGKPAIMIPMFADQGRNALMLSRHGGAVVLDKKDLHDSKKIADTIKKVINDDSYRKETLKNWQRGLKKIPIGPEKDFGRLPNLVPHGRHLSLIQYYLVDVIALVITGLVTSLIILFFVFSEKMSQLPCFFLALLSERAPFYGHSGRMPTAKVVVFFFIFLFQTSFNVNAYKVLVYNVLAGHSHVKFMSTLADTLTEAGHDVTVLFPVLDPSSVNKTTLKLTEKTIFVPLAEELKPYLKKRSDDMRAMWKAPVSSMSMLHNMKVVSIRFSTQCVILFEALKLPSSVAAYSAVVFDHVSGAIGKPAATSYVPGLTANYKAEMSLLERLGNTFQYYLGVYVFSTVGDDQVRLIRQFMPNMRDWREIIAESSFIFTNSHPFLDFPGPTLQKIVPIGGISVRKPVGELDQEWEEVLSKRKSTILVSFGSNLHSKRYAGRVQEIPSNSFRIDARNDVHLEIRRGRRQNRRSLAKCQTEHLADDRLTTFITHGGLGSSMELAFLGKPAIMVPIYADQGRNAFMLERHGGVIILEKENLEKPEKIIEAIRKILNDERYSKNAKILSKALENYPLDAKDTFVRHVEFAAQFGRLPSMDPYGRKLSTFQYYLVDVIFFIIFVSISLSFLVYLTIRWEEGAKEDQEPRILQRIE
ncbi:unnamed protein product [Caenorhabditis auriculariae]|uniref:glucuronosyltransferase n=1 Tax=Caenorhabditis auriculariae TaxID=2777116 RepID=A0A8S1H381_9PELO|nr:unnamed protein product [Caenorhabditis auriculariae]